jgi:hypothetical protein
LLSNVTGVNLRARRIILVGIVVALVAATVGGVLVRAGTSDQEEITMRWDIISVNFATLTLSAGGIASARANDMSEITLTGSGTFVAPAAGGGPSSDVTGGGTWKTFDPSGAPTGSGTYEVTGLVRWDLAPGTPPLPNDNIGNGADSRAGLVVLRVSYNDGSRGVLTVSCHLVGSPDTMFEGITTSKGFVDYWNREKPPAPPGEANRTNFHVVPEGGD